jgi:hypothetical protein
MRATADATITGNIRPRTAGSSIQLEKLVGKEWKAIGQVVQSDAQGNFSLTISGQQRGVLAFRVTVAADALWSVVTSPTFNIIVR